MGKKDDDDDNGDDDDIPHRLDSLFSRKFSFMRKTLFVLIVYLSTQNKYICSV